MELSIENIVFPQLDIIIIIHTLHCMVNLYRVCGRYVCIPTTTTYN